MQRLHHYRTLTVALLAFVVACERAPDSSATTQTASDRLREAARSLKDEAKETARTVREEAKEVGGQIRQAAQEAAAQARESATAMKEEAVAMWASTREEALSLSATALEKTRETLAALREKARQASDVTRPMIERAIAELEEGAKAIGVQTEKVKSAPPEEWQRVGRELGPQIEELKSAADSAARTFGVAAAGAKPAGDGPKLTGTVSYREKIALPDGAQLTVRIFDVTKAGEPATLIAEGTFPAVGPSPIAFALAYDSAKVDANGLYAAEAVIESAGETLFATPERIPVLPHGKPARTEITVMRPLE